MAATKKAITCELAHGELTSKDIKKLLKLKDRIKEGKGIAEKFKKSDYDTKKILLAKIIYTNKNRKEILTLLHHAISNKNRQAIKDLSEKAKERELLKKELNEEVIIKCSDG